LNHFKRHAAFSREHVDGKIAAIIWISLAIVWISWFNLTKKQSGGYRLFGRWSRLGRTANLSPTGVSYGKQIEQLACLDGFDFSSGRFPGAERGQFAVVYAGLAN
jgi:hypothetical protein